MFPNEHNCVPEQNISIFRVIQKYPATQLNSKCPIFDEKIPRQKKQ